RESHREPGLEPGQRRPEALRHRRSDVSELPGDTVLYWSVLERGVQLDVLALLSGEPVHLPQRGRGDGDAPRLDAIAGGHSLLERAQRDVADPLVGLELEHGSGAEWWERDLTHPGINVEGDVAHGAFAGVGGRELAGPSIAVDDARTHQRRRREGR